MIQQLKAKIDQHEQTISQLINMMAYTNRALFQLSHDVKHMSHHFPHINLPQKKLVKRNG